MCTAFELLEREESVFAMHATAMAAISSVFRLTALICSVPSFYSKYSVCLLFKHTLNLRRVIYYDIQTDEREYKTNWKYYTDINRTTETDDCTLLRA